MNYKWQQAICKPKYERAIAAAIITRPYLALAIMAKSSAVASGGPVAFQASTVASGQSAVVSQVSAVASGRSAVVSLVSAVASQASAIAVVVQLCLLFLACVSFCIYLT